MVRIILLLDLAGFVCQRKVHMYWLKSFHMGEEELDCPSFLPWELYDIELLCLVHQFYQIPVSLIIFP